MTSLRDQLSARAAASRERLDEGTTAAMLADIADVARAGIADRALGVGDQAPPVVLPGATGSTVDLADLLARGPVVVSFYRGGWCPYCNMELRALQDRLDDLAAAGASLVAISPNTPDASLTTAETNDLAFPVLSDADNAVARSFGLVHELTPAVRELYEGWGFDLAGANDSDGSELPLPATYVLDAQGVVRFAFVDPDYKVRAEPDDVVAAVRGIVA